MIRTKLLLICCCAALAIPGFAQNSAIGLTQNPRACSPVGTWYGGGDFKYVLTITPNGGGNFAMRGEGAFDNASFGYKGWTSFSTQFVKLKDGRYLGHGIGMFTTSSEVPPPLNSLELDGIRAWMEFIDCDNIKFTYDFFGAYFDLTKIPFIDPPDLDYLPPGGIQETYRRMPTKCNVCGLPSLPTANLRHRH